MRYIEKHTLPTGYLFTSESSKGSVETLSIGDYGKRYNVRADFLGYTREIHGVPNVPCMPLSEKWVMTISTQRGCKMNCNFCSVPEVEWGGNLTQQDLLDQIILARQLFPEVKYTERLNIHYARMGEPIFNDNVFELSRFLADNKRSVQDILDLRVEVIHPVLTTSLPRKLKQLESRIIEWCGIKNFNFNGQAGFQFSINSTNEKQREEMFGGLSLTLPEFAKIAEKMPVPLSRKYCLNFAYSTDFEINAKYLTSLFDPEKFMVKITPIHNNHTCVKNEIKTVGGYDSWQPYKKPEEELKAEGWDVLVFVPSMDEENGLVTCGNVVLGGDIVKCKTDVVNIEGISQNL